MRLVRHLDPPTAALGLTIVLAGFFLVGLLSWVSGLHVAGTVMMLLAVHALVFGLVVLGGFVLAGLPRTAPFAERNQLTARLAWISRSVWAAIVLAAGGYFGAIIATDLGSPTTYGAPNRIAYLVSVAVLLAGFAAVFVVIPIAVVSGVGLIRAGRRARRTALRKTLKSHVVTETWVEHLSSPIYAYAALFGFVAAVPLVFALVFWITVGLGISY